MTLSSPSIPAKDAFCLMDLLHELKSVSSAIVEFHTENANDLKDAAAKHLLVMSDALDYIFENGYK